MTDMSHPLSGGLPSATMTALHRSFEETGFVALPSRLEMEAVLPLRSYLDDLCSRDGPERVVETDGRPYSAYIDASDVHINRLARSAPLLPIAEMLLGAPVYLYQCKANPKAALSGSELDWHQDFAHWQEFDHMPNANALTAAILLDDVDSHLAGPLLLAKSTHGSVLPIADESVNPDEVSTASGTEISWSSTKRLGRSTVVSPLRFRIPDHILGLVLLRSEIKPVFGTAGTVVLFHANLLHAANRNLSPRSRRMLFLTYNLVSNVPTSDSDPREHYIVNPDHRPLLPL